MFNFTFKKSAVKDIDSLPSQVRNRVLRKLKFYSLQDNPLEFADKLKDRRFGEYRFRIGDYRVILDVSDRAVIILKVGHRRDVYK